MSDGKPGPVAEGSPCGLDQPKGSRKTWPDGKTSHPCQGSIPQGSHTRQAEHEQPRAAEANARFTHLPLAAGIYQETAPAPARAPGGSAPRLRSKCQRQAQQPPPEAKTPVRVGSAAMPAPFALRGGYAPSVRRDVRPCRSCRARSRHCAGRLDFARHERRQASSGTRANRSIAPQPPIPPISQSAGARYIVHCTTIRRISAPFCGEPSRQGVGSSAPVWVWQGPGRKGASMKRNQPVATGKAGVAFMAMLALAGLAASGRAEQARSPKPRSPPPPARSSYPAQTRGSPKPLPNMIA